LTGTAMLLRERRPALPALAVGALVGAYLIRSPIIAGSALSMPSPARTSHIVFQGRSQQIGQIFGIGDLSAGTLFAVLILAACALLAALRTRRVPPALVGGTVFFGLALVAAGQTGYTLKKFADTQGAVSHEYLVGRNWIDRAIGDRKANAIVGETVTAPATWQIYWETIFYNKAVDRIYVERGRDPYLQTFNRPFSIDGRGRVHGLEPRPYVVASQTERRFA